MSTTRVKQQSASDIPGWNTRGVVRWVLGWAVLAVVVHLFYLLVVCPTIDREIVFFLAGKNGVGLIGFEIDAHPAAVVSTIALVGAAAGAGIALALYRAHRKGAHTVAVLSLALIAGSLGLTAGGVVAAVVGQPITEPGLAGGLPGIVAAAVFLSQLVPLMAGKRGRRARAAV